jgi:DNA-binding transcriptional ArsR family regulator
MRELKSQLYDQVARLGKALPSPKRLELIELLCQGEKTVESLEAQAEISVKLASAPEGDAPRAPGGHAQGRQVRAVPPGAGTIVADLWVHLRSEAEERLVELQMALSSIVEHGDELQGVDRADILRRAAAGEVVVLDVRPEEEFAAAHLPHARSLPVTN